MMTMKEKIERASASVAFDGIYKYIKKNPEENLIKLVDLAQKLMGGAFPEKNFDAFRSAVQDKDNVWRTFALNIINGCDKNVVKNMLLALGLGAGVNGTKAVRANREKYKCNIPFQVLFDPTSACNLKCKGCWSAEYGHKSNLTLDEMRSIINQCTELGTHFYMLTGGEPLIRKKDIITLCRENPDCAFLAYTNATLIDQELCDEIRSVGNLALALSIEGTEESNDARRGGGAYKTTIEAMDLLRENGLLFGISVCYTSANIPAVTSDEFLDLMVEKGVRFGLYFNYMPVGKDAVPELIPTPEQRVHMYKWLRKVRNSKIGKPMFVMDFQNDAEYVGGCIAGGRNYFHINSEGDMEPCVFIHYSDSNIREKTILEGLQSPLFKAYYHNQPFNDNHLRPCPLLENPDCLRKMVAQTGAKSTDLIEPESAEQLCSKCDRFAAAWKPVAEELWASTKHPNPKTQYYRDTPEGKAEKK
ncbi:MAG: radical SAM protein [Ruminococcaceae bacterium]|nr:radical SAM protein [Oscillospiraceae bacterium]